MKNKQIKKTTQQKNPTTKTSRTINQQNSRNYYDLLGIALIIILGIIIYSNSFDCSFHFDDTGSIVDNPAIRNLSDIKSIWNYSNNRFVAYFTFALNYHFGKLDVWGYHLVNLMIHLTTSIIVWWLTVLIFSTPAMKDKEISKNKKIIALFTALLFVSHPLATQSVTYIVQRLASMVAMFYLLSLTLYVKARLSDKKNLSRYLLFTGACISAILALFTKENAYTLPFAVILFEIFFLQTKKIKINLKDYRVILVFVGFLSLLVLMFLNFSSSVFDPIPPAQGNAFNVTSINYFLTQFSVIVKYIQLLLLPLYQNLDYDFPISNNFFELKTIISFVFLISIFYLSIFLFNKSRIISFGIFWFFLSLAIESSIIPIHDVIFEHRTYLPSFGFLLIFSSVIYNFLSKKYKVLAILFFSIVILTSSILSFERNKVWKDDLTLWTDVIAKSPKKPRPNAARGDYYVDHKQWNEAIADYSKAIENNPKYEQAYCNRGVALGNNEKWDNAISDYTKAIEIDPKYVKAYFNRGVSKGNLGQWDSAIVDYKKALNIFPKYAEAYYACGIAYGNIGKWENAIFAYSKAIDLNSNYREAFRNRGFAYRKLNHLDKAIADYSKAIEVDPKFAEVYSNRGVVYGSIGQTDKALDDFSKSIELNPNYAEAYFNRGITFLSIMQLSKAIADFNKAIEINPNYKEAYSNRDIAIKKMQIESVTPNK